MLKNPMVSDPRARSSGQDLRIIGGRLRGSKLRYHGDPLVRPMKHRVREAMFNLISTGSEGRYAIDLFAGTGALGLEALSRGAVGATFIERHVPSARVLEENMASLGVCDQCRLLVTSAFLWGKRDLPCGGSEHPAARPTASPPPRDVPWVVFCSPPYDFYVERQADMLVLVGTIMKAAPEETILVVEADERFNYGLLPGADWDVRSYPPAVLGLWRGGGSSVF